MACEVFGPGVDGTKLHCNSPTEFWVDVPEVEKTSLQVTVQDQDEKYVEFKQEESGGRYHISYTPKQIGLHTVRVTYCSRHVCGSPFQVRVHCGPCTNT